MTPFLAIAVVMLAIACACVLVPLLKHRRGVPVDSDASNLLVLRAQRAELEADLANGVLSPEHYDVARRDLERRVLEEADGAAEGGAPPSRGSAWTAALVGAGFPVAAALLYLTLGTPSALLADTVPDAARAARETPSAQDIETMIERVKARLATRPDDIEGWRVLARTYYVLGRAPEAVAAYERASALAPDDAELLADFADAVAITQNRSLDGRPEALVVRALSANPDQWKANALAGTIAFQRRDYGKSIAHWTRAKAALPADSPAAQSIESSLAEARKLAGTSSPGPDAAAMLSEPPAKPGPKATSVSGKSVSGTVTLAPSLRSGVTPEDTVFVFARPADGSRMPLAILRVKGRDLPLAFTLDDSTAMTPSRKLSDFPEVIVGARISKSGNATPQPGDLEARTAGVKLGATGVAIVIDRRLP